MYKVLAHFTDLQDDRYEYNPGDEFPRKGLNVSAERLDELSSDKNRRHTPVIELIKEPEPVAEEKEPAKKPARRRTKKNAD